jgi:TatD DNase family protein
MIVDSHCHLHDPAFADLPSALARALQCDVWGVVAVGCDPASNRTTLESAKAHPKAVWPALGFHPDWPQLGEAELAEVEAQVAAHHPRMVAVGEVGLPWYSLDGPPDVPDRRRRARTSLQRLLDLAARYDLAVILHAPHGAAADALELLRATGIERAVFHWHKASLDVTRAILDAGYLISVTPELVYRERDRELVQWAPLDGLLVESDGPWPYRGEFESIASGPWLASRVAEEIAKIKRLPVDEVMYRIGENTCRLFELVWR